MITFTSRVGTAPGTTTLIESSGPLGVMQCYPPVVPIHLQPPPAPPAAPLPAAGTRVVYDPYPNGAALKGGLGFVLAPWEINRTLPGGAPYLNPFDPQYITRGEQGYYYDTPLGAIPTDAELATNECYTPVQSGWIAAKEGYIPPPWVPPDGWRPVAPQYGPPTSLNGAQQLGEVAGQLGDVAEELAKHQRRTFYLQIVSTFAIVAVACTAVIKALQSSKQSGADYADR